MNEPISIKDYIDLESDEIKGLREDAEYDVDVLEERITLFAPTRKEHDIPYNMAAERLANEHARGVLANILAGSESNSAAVAEVIVDINNLGKTPKVIINTPEKFAEAREVLAGCKTNIMVNDIDGRLITMIDGNDRVDPYQGSTPYLTELCAVRQRIAKFVKEGK